MPPPLELTARQHVVDGKHRRTLKLSRTGSPDREFFFEFSEGAPPGEITEMDPFVFAVIFLAMQEHSDLRIRGPMTRSAMRNLLEFQGIWSSWKPGVYRSVQLLPDSVIDVARNHSTPRAMAAFSGGTDSVFTVLSHAGPAKPAGALPLTDLLLVHGFDIGVDDFDSLATLRERSRSFVEGLGLHFRTIRTNLKRDSGQRWEDSYATQLAACLHQYAPEFTYALLGSSEPYASLFLPWGSNPLTDPLLSSDRMQLMLDGCRFSRTEKIATLSTHPQAVAGLSVCWEGASGRNCGHCEKCIRTQLNFLAAGHDKPACFDAPLELKAVRTMPLRNHPQYHELVSLRDYARAHGRSGQWLGAVDRRIVRYHLYHRWINAARTIARQSRWTQPIRRLRASLAGSG
jgi:hypothetical protein